MIKNQLETCLYVDIDSFYTIRGLKGAQLVTEMSGRCASYILGTSRYHSLLITILKTNKNSSETETIFPK